MPLPDGFSEWENLQSLVLLEHNRAVRNWFRNQADNDVSTPKARLKHTCLIKDEDTVAMTQLRMWLFEVTVGHTQSLQRPVYAIPVSEAQTNWTYKPQVTLHFLERWDRETHENEKIPLAEGEISFRLMDETSETITRTKAEQLAREIKREFGTPIFTWEKGWYKCTYFDAQRGYDLRLLVKSKAEGEKVVRQVLKVQNHTFDRDNFQFIEHDRTYPANPGTHRVYGRTVKKPHRRRRADVRFKYAQLSVWGRPTAINLVASTGTRLRSVIELI